MADAMAAKQSSKFKMHEIGIELHFPAAGIRIKEAAFHYFQPLHGEGRHTWEELRVSIETPRSPELKGSITGSRWKAEDAVPTAAPANIIAPEKAIALLNRAPMNTPKEQEPDKDKSRWTVTLQLIQIGAKYWGAGNPRHFPTASVHTGEKGTYRDEPFFAKTAPRSKWVWWTVVQHVTPVRYKYVYEYIYMDAVTGKATSHCAEQPSPWKPLVAVACPPPR
jgi:hypothetical protein